MAEYTVSLRGQFKDIHTIEASSAEEAEEKAIEACLNSMSDVEIDDVWSMKKVKSSIIARGMAVCLICFDWKSKGELTPSDEQGKVWNVCRVCTAEEWCECPYTEWVHYPHQVKEHDESCLSNYESTPCGGCLSCCIRQYDYYQEAMKDEEPFMGDGYDPYDHINR